MDSKIVAMSEKSKYNLPSLNQYSSKSLTDVDKIADEWSTLFDDIERAQRGIMEIRNSDAMRRTTATDLQDVRNQIDAVKAYEDALRPMQKRLEYLLYRGCYLIRSAFPTIDTSKLEAQLKNLTETSN